jgi:5-formyltetrahydrofolate cyclo-ligase
MTSTRIGAAKKATRQAVIAQRDALDSAARQRKSLVITQRLIALPAYTAAHTVAAYATFGSEFDTGPFVAALLAAGKRLMLPRVVIGGRELQFHFVTDPARCLLPGKWGIPEPDPAQCAVAAVTEADFLLVPGVAFTPRCERLGYGGGFYDHAICASRSEVPKVAAAFNLQIVDTLPVEPHDRPVDLVVTEDAEYAHRG